MKNDIYPQCKCGILEGMCWDCKTKNYKGMDQIPESVKIEGLWKALQLAVFERHIKDVVKMSMSLKYYLDPSLKQQEAKKRKAEIVYEPVDNDLPEATITML